MKNLLNVQVNIKMEKPYSKRELDVFFKTIGEQIVEAKEDLKAQLDRIEEQTIKTNGSVRSLKEWRAWITGGGAVVSLIVIPLFCWMLYTLSNIDNLIRASVQTALIPYVKE